MDSIQRMKMKKMCRTIKKKKKEKSFFLAWKPKQQHHNECNLRDGRVIIWNEETKVEKKRKHHHFWLFYTMKEAHVSQWLHLFNFIQLIIMKQVKKTPELFIFLTDSLVSPSDVRTSKLYVAGLCDVYFRQNS